MDWYPIRGGIVTSRPVPIVLGNFWASFCFFYIHKRVGTASLVDWECCKSFLMLQRCADLLQRMFSLPMKCNTIAHNLVFNNFMTSHFNLLITEDIDWLFSVQGKAFGLVTHLSKILHRPLSIEEFKWHFYNFKFYNQYVWRHDHLRFSWKK